MCEDYVLAFDRLIEHSHVRRPVAGAFFTYVDCDISPNLCSLFHVNPNLMVNMQSLWPCDIYLPEEHDPGVRFHCPFMGRIVALPLKSTPLALFKLSPAPLSS